MTGLLKIIKMARAQTASTSGVPTVISTLNQSLWTETARDLGDFRE